MKISKVLYINLDHRKYRLASIQEVLSHCPHLTHRIQGIKPSDEDLVAYKTICNKKIYSANGVVGCVLSHKKCIEYLLSQDLSDDEYCLILEDDVQIHKSFWRLLETINIEEDADVIFFDSVVKARYSGLHLYNNTYPLLYKIPIGNNCDHPDHIELHGNGLPCFCGTHCLAYKNSKLKRMINWFNNIEAYANIDMMLILDKELNRYIVQTGLVWQHKGKLGSDISYRQR